MEIAGLQDFREFGAPGDLGVFQLPCSYLVFPFTFSGVTRYVALNGHTGAVTSDADAITLLHGVRDALGANYGVIYIKKAQYNLAVAAFVPLSKQTWVFEDGVIFEQQTNDVNVVTIDGTIGTHKEYITIHCEGRTIFRHLTGAGNEYGIEMRYCDHVSIIAKNQLLVTKIGLSGVCTSFTINDSLFERVKVTDFGNAGAGVRMGWNGNGDSNRNTWLMCEADGTDSPALSGACFYFGTDYGNSFDNHIISCKFSNSKDNGIYLNGVTSNDSTEGWIIELTVCRNNAKAGILIKAFKNFQVESCTCIGNLKGIEINTSIEDDTEGGIVSGVFSGNTNEGVSMYCEGGTTSVHHIKLNVVCEGNGRGISLYIDTNNRAIQYIWIVAISYGNGSDGISIKNENNALQVIKYIFVSGFFNSNTDEGVDIGNQFGISNLYFSNGTSLGNGTNWSDPGAKGTREADFIIV